MAKMYNELEPSQNVPPKWLDRIALKMNRNNFIGVAFSWLHQLNDLSAKFIKGPQLPSLESYSFKFTEPTTQDAVTCHFDLFPEEKRVALTINKESLTEGVLGDAANTMAFKLLRLFKGELVLEEEPDSEGNRVASVHTGSFADIDSESGEITDYSVFTMRRSQLKVKSQTDLPTEMIAPVFIYERRLFESNEQPDIFTDDEYYEEELVKKASVKQVRFTLDNSIFSQYTISAKTIAIYDDQSNQVQKVVIILEVESDDDDAERQVPYQKQILEFRPENYIDDQTWEAEEVVQEGAHPIISEQNFPRLEFAAGGVKVRVPFQKVNLLIPSYIDMHFPQKFPAPPANLNHAPSIVFSSSSEF